MEQLPLSLPAYRRKQPEIVGPKCPACRQRLLTPEQRLVMGQLLGAWILRNWDFAMLELLRHQAYHPAHLSLDEHPGLLWALKADAKEHGLSPAERLAQIIDSYYQNEVKELDRCAASEPTWRHAVASGHVFAYRSDRPWAGRPDSQSVYLGAAHNASKAYRLFSAWAQKDAPSAGAEEA